VIHACRAACACRTSNNANRRIPPAVGRTPTTSTSEEKVPLAKNSMPWETGSTHGKYQYYPGGDSSAAPKDAPSAVNVVVVPDVELPKVRAFPPMRALPIGRLTRFVQRLHDKYNKWGKEGY